MFANVSPFVVLAIVAVLVIFFVLACHPKPIKANDNRPLTPAELDYAREKLQEDITWNLPLRRTGYHYDAASRRVKKDC